LLEVAALAPQRLRPVAGDPGEEKAIWLHRFCKEQNQNGVTGCQSTYMNRILTCSRCMIFEHKGL